jgi:peptide/nickel transport system ATP-binding protein
MLSGGKIQGQINLDGESILDLSESEFDEKFRWKKISMIFQGAMNSLDPVFTIKDQFEEVLKQHNFAGDFKETISDAIRSVSLDESVLKKLKKDGMAFMLITHDLAVLSEIANKIGIMYGGQMVEFGSSFEIYKNPKHPYTQGLLESIPTLKGGTPKYIKGIPPSLLDAPTECRFIDRCPLVIDKCKQVPPKFKTKTGYVRCWLYEEEK